MGKKKDGETSKKEKEKRRKEEREESKVLEVMREDGKTEMKGGRGGTGDGKVGREGVR